MTARERGRKYGARTRTIDLSQHFDFPPRGPRDTWWRQLADRVRSRYPTGHQRPWGIPFKMAEGSDRRLICLAKDRPQVTIHLNGKADFLCLLHEWYQLPDDVRMEQPAEGLVVAEYEITYADGSTYVHPVRARFEVSMAESPGPAWLAMPFNVYEAVDPANHPPDQRWGDAQQGQRWEGGEPLVYAMPNPNPDRRIESITLRGLCASPLVVAGLTLYQGSDNPLRHLPRRKYGVQAGNKPCRIAKADIDLGVIARIEHPLSPCDQQWLQSPFAGTETTEPDRGDDVIAVVGAQDATVSLELEGEKKRLKFSLGEAFHKGSSPSGEARLQVLGKRRQWMRLRIIDGSTGQPTPARVHMCGSAGEYIAPYGHHDQVNTNWFEDYGADVLVAGRAYAYVPGEFPTDMPVGDVYVELNKGFEYEPIRRKVTVRPGQEVLELEINRWKDLRSEGWVTADTHVHFISPHTAWLEAQAEGVNVVNLLASQWGRLFTNVGDFIGRVGINEDDTIVYVGTENRNHMLGHISMLGTRGLPVYPMCSGGPFESWVGDPDFIMLAEWALENRRKGGISIRPHFPYCGFTEDPVPILKGLVDALEIRPDRDFAIQEWYRYLNCGYRVAVVAGTDKMSASQALGWRRTYAKIATDEPFTYDNWANAVRAGRTISTNGPLVDLKVEGSHIGDSIQLPERGGTLEVHATAECFRPLSRLEVVCNGKVVASEEAEAGRRALQVKEKIRVTGSGWIAARCKGLRGDPGQYMAAHTSPVYIKCGQTRAFDGPAAQHMLALVEGGIEYLNNLAVVFDERSRKRMVKLFNEARRELKGRLVVEAKHFHHHADALYHHHGHSGEADHHH